MPTLTPPVPTVLRRRGRAAAASPCARAVARHRRAGGPEDRALYRCSECGHGFRADVSASVGCPRCGSTQAW